MERCEDNGLPEREMEMIGHPFKSYQRVKNKIAKLEKKRESIKSTDESIPAYKENQEALLALNSMDLLKARDERELECEKLISWLRSRGEDAQNLWDRAGGDYSTPMLLEEDHHHPPDFADKYRKEVEAAGGVQKIIDDYNAGEIKADDPRMIAITSPWEMNEDALVKRKAAARRAQERWERHAFIEDRLNAARARGDAEYIETFKDSPAKIMQNYAKSRADVTRYRKMEKEAEQAVIDYLNKQGPHAQKVWEESLAKVTRRY